MEFKKKLSILVLFMLVYFNKKVFFLFIFKQELCNIFLLLNLWITHNYGAAQTCPKLILIL